MIGARARTPWDRRDLLVAAALVAIVGAVYARTIGGDFVNWDDDRFITRNPLWTEDAWTYVRAAWTRVQFEAYQPLHLMAYLPDRALWPDSAAGFHALNVAIFAGDVALAYALARGHVGRMAAAGACLIVALHPLCVEPVAWITSRKDVVALGLFLGALLVEDRRGGALARPSIGGVALGAAAMLTKTATVCLPVVLVAWLVWLRGARLRVALARALPYAALAAAASIAVATIWSGHRLIGTSRPASAPIDVLATLAFYAQSAVAPIGRSPIYPAAPLPETFAAALVVAAAVALALGWRRLPAAARYAAVAFVAALLPIANLVPSQFRFADRYALLALFALVVPLAMAIDRLRPRIAIALCAVVLAAEAAVSVGLAGAWHDSRALWTRAVAAQPDAFYARVKLGETLRDGGDWRGAIAEYQAAIRLAPDDTIGYVGLFYVYARRAEAAGAIAAGTADRWLAAIGGALDDPRAFAAFFATVPHAGCAPCSNLLLGMALLRWPQPDATLITAARAALDRGERDAALVYLSSVRDRATPGFDELLRRTR